ncbi:hypothetical protein ACNY9Y_003689 [Cronobacter dublinensis]
MPEFLHAWNAPREAIASPYLTYEQERRRDRMIAALLHARNELEKQPDLVRYGVRRRADELEREHDVQRANAFLVNFTRRALPRLELVAEKYRIEAISPDVALPVFDGRDDDVSAR